MTPRPPLDEIDAPSVPVPLTVHELRTLRDLVGYERGRSERKAARTVERGVELPGENANACRAERLGAIEEKLEAWLKAAWPVVSDARREAGERESWLCSSRREGAEMVDA